MRLQIDNGFRRRNRSVVFEVFQKYCTTSCDEAQHIQKDRIQTALNDLDLDVSVKEVESLFNEFDSDNSDGLSQEEFCRMLQKLRPVHEWAKSLPIAEVLVDSLPRKANQQQLKVVSELTDDEISVVCMVFARGVERILQESRMSLMQAFQIEPGAETGSKFNMVPVSCGDIDDFHQGLEQRIGFACMSLCFLVLP